MPSQRLPAESVLHALHGYGSAGIAAFGWAVCQLLGLPAGPWLPLWFCAGLFVYNLDRLRIDPTDRLSTPARAEASAQLRGWMRAAVILSAAVLVVLPLARRDWLTLACTVAGSGLAFFYPVPLGRQRLKDIPLLKTFLPPGFVLAAVFGLPLLHAPGAGLNWWLLLWAGAVLMGNMILCDARDARWDRAAGVVSLPGALGLRGTRAALWLCVALGAGWGVGWIGAGTDAYLAALVLAARRPRGERFYERWVEGVLFIPALLVLIGRA